MTIEDAQLNEKKELSRDFKGVWIPREIWLHESLSIQAKTLWAEIWSLHDRKKGGCYASDEYLSSFSGLKKTRLHEVLKELKEANLLEKIAFDGRSRILKAVMPQADYGESSEPSSPESRVPGYRKAEVRDPGKLPLYKRTKTLSKDKEKEGGKTPKAPAYPTSSKIKRREHVHTTAQEHDHLLDLHGPEKTKACYDFLQEWKEDTPRSKWKKSDYRSILRWVVEAVEERAKKKGATNAPIDNRAHAEKIAENYNLSVGPRKQVRLTVLNDRLEIVSTCPTANISPTTIRYKENGFVDQLENALRKWRLK